MYRLDERLQSLGKRLATLTDNVSHYWRSRQTPPFIVWQEDDRNDLKTNGHHAEKSVIGTVDLYTKQEWDDLRWQIENVLEQDACCAWYLNSIQWEEDTGLLHFEWVFQIG